MGSQVRRILFVIGIVWMACCAHSRVLSQETAANAKGKSRTPELPLYEQPPFDVIVLDEANQGSRLRVFPLPIVRLPQAVPADRKFAIRLIDDDEYEYEVTGRNIRTIELFEELLLREGNRLVDLVSPSQSPAETAGQLADAYRHYSRVHQLNPDFPGLREAVKRCLFHDAGNLNAQEKYAEAFAVLEELFQRDPNYRLTNNSRPISEVMSVPLDRALNEYFQAGDYAEMRSLLDRIVQKYAGLKLAAVGTWIAKLNGLAVRKRDAGRQQLIEKRYRESFESVREMLEIWPMVEGGRQLNADVAAAYPIVFVGVTQPALDFDAARLDNWAVRRTGQLVHRTLVEFLGAGAEGGRYQFSLGSLDHSEDRRQLVLQVNPTGGVVAEPLTGYEVARRLLRIASPASPDYVPAWEC